MFGKILDFLGFLAKSKLLLGFLGKIIYTSTDILLEKSYLDPFPGKINFTYCVSWQDPIILGFFLGKILDFFGSLAMLIIHLRFLGRILHSSVSCDINFTFWVSWQDPILVRVFLDKMLDIFSFFGTS